jgi:hypothetical protein
MRLPHLLNKSNIDSIGYDTVYLEKPMSNLIDFDWKNILKQPPKNSDNATIEELKFISKNTLNRSINEEKQILQIDAELDGQFINLLKKYNIQYPQNYINLFYDIVRPLLYNTKAYWNRARPKQLAELLNIPINIIATDTHHTASYPSGHTVYSSLVANILKDMYPQIDHKKLDNIVLSVAEARVKQGVHFPSDNKGSLLFSKFIFNKLNPKLRKYNNE